MTRSLDSAVAVVGGGQMGTGIAHAFLVLGAQVNVVEPDARRAELAREGVRRGVVRTCEKAGGADDPDSYMARLRTTGRVADLPAGLDVVVEAVPESSRLKADVLAKVERAVSADTVLASNTSSLSITELSAALSRPERFIGMHFFNPVPASVLVELVTGERTDQSVTERARDLVARLGKEAIVVRDSPGFVTSRLGLALGLEAMRMYEAGIATAPDIDRAMVLGYRHPVGPLRLTDLVGLDVRLAVAEHLARELGSRFSPPDVLRTMVAEGMLGKKTGQGFHAWA